MFSHNPFDHLLDNILATIMGKRSISDTISLLPSRRPSLQKSFKNLELNPLIKSMEKETAIKETSLMDLKHFKKIAVAPATIETTLKEKFDLTYAELALYAVYPFGGFIRDSFHQDDPTDLDAILASKEQAKAFATYLETKGWSVEDLNTKATGYTTHQYRLTKDNLQIDLVYANKPKKGRLDFVELSSLDFSCNAYLLDPTSRYLFAWNSFEDFNLFQKKQILIAKPLDKDKYKNKIVRLFAHGWSFNYDNVLNYLTPDLALHFFTHLPQDQKEYLIHKALTHPNTVIREQAQFFNHISVEKVPSSLIHDFYLKHFFVASKALSRDFPSNLVEFDVDDLTLSTEILTPEEHEIELI